jgi:hypothetical protein
MQFRVVIQNADGSEKWEIPFYSFSFSEELNNDRSATVSFDRQALREIAETYGKNPLYVLSNTYRELYIYDEDDNLIYGGYIADLQFSRGNSEEGNMAVASKGFFSLLRKRYTANLDEYTSEDLSDIAWSLIDYTQNLSYGNFGITRGTNPTTRDADRTFRYKEIADAIEGMSNAETKDGIDFEITNNKVFNVYYPAKGSTRKSVIFEDGNNILNYNIRKPFIDSMANQVFVYGDGFGEDAVIEVRDAENSFKNAFFLLQDTLSEKDVKLTATLQAKGDRYLDKNKYPQLGVSIVCDYDVIDYSEFSLGDWVRLKISDWEINAMYRVVKRGVTNNGDVYLTLDPTI